MDFPHPSQTKEQKQQPKQQPIQQQNSHSHSHSRSRSGSSSRSSKSSKSISSPFSDSLGSAQQKKQVKKQQNQVQPRIRYKYCCKFCKQTDSSKNKKACVCVVPKGQRRTQIGDHGCQTCGCNGCSKQDFISRGEDPQYKPNQKNQHGQQQSQYQHQNQHQHQQNHNKRAVLQEFQARNGCCRKCMKAFSKSNKSCLCQVPQNVRNTKLPSTGCKICGCFGCNPQDKKQKQKQHKSQRKSTYPLNIDSSVRRQRSRSRDKSRNKHKKQRRSKSSSSQQVDMSVMNFHNVDKSVVGSMIINDYRVNPGIMGFGIPQRSYNYIVGKPK